MRVYRRRPRRGRKRVVRYKRKKRARAKIIKQAAGPVQRVRGFVVRKSPRGFKRLR